MDKSEYIQPQIYLYRFELESIMTTLSDTVVQGGYAAGALANYTTGKVINGQQHQITTVKDIFELNY